MIVDLRTLKPNPRRDFLIDPMDDTQVAQLKASIEEDGFWGGVICRQTPTGIEIGAGHHRVRAAIEAGIMKADVTVCNGDMDDRQMIRIYARENATQRSTTSTAQVGSVAAALKYVAKAILTGDETSVKFNRRSLESIRGNISSDKGIGREVIVEFLDNVPGINGSSVMQALANLKTSGDYARIIEEVYEEIKQEEIVALKALEDARKEQERLRKEKEEAEKKARLAKEADEKKKAEEEAREAELKHKEAQEKTKQQVNTVDAVQASCVTAEKAKEAATTEPISDANGKPTMKRKKRDPTFDFAGVSKHFKNSHQVDVFRERATHPTIAAYLPVDRQAALAKELVALAKKYKKELSGEFIKNNITDLVVEFKQTQRQLDKRQEEAIARQDLLFRCKKHQEDFMRGCGVMLKAGYEISRMAESWPKDLTFPIDSELRDMIKTAREIIITLDERI